MLLCNQAFELKQEANVDMAYFRLERKNEKRAMQLSSLCKSKLICLIIFWRVKTLFQNSENAEEIF